ncbi:response regulator transcription factor [Diplocloster agilis]|uniref:Stage 0 sporulation protein A homolog n=1 Tax=Diplocloster agilis TaxID=2850323 RepID=A0A949NFZ3_9FIRM|nr:response regulator transcription factor [Diplocloster agilis]MBU9735783.1 response regulator transcription factor [Diplocloster agilis]MBU9742861.1 response regulator transcription factor [Diplocloster agilis]
MITILIVEDESAIAELIQAGFEKAGYAWDYAADGKQAADKIEVRTYDLVLLDIMLPEIDGYELMEYIEPLGIPVIFLTAKGTTSDKVKGLRMGADDYIVKPFEIDELLARVDSVLRRYNKGQTLLYAADVVIDTQSRRVMQNGQEIMLTPKEYELLLFLVRNKNSALYRETLFERVWMEDFTGDSRTLDLHIQRLRKKLNWKDRIKTVYKIGYILEVST